MKNTVLIIEFSISTLATRSSVTTLGVRIITMEVVIRI